MASESSRSSKDFTEEALQGPVIPVDLGFMEDVSRTKQHTQNLTNAIGTSDSSKSLVSRRDAHTSVLSYMLLTSLLEA